jgi:ABC-type antimicrobial peptide transport system permease subunit
LGGFAAAGLLLAVVGIYGTLSYMVGQRTREMGVRLALGATPSQVLHLVVRHGLTLGLLGILLGGGGAIIASRSLSGFLYEITPLDPWTYAVVALTLAAAALVATLAPALRATRIDPVAALKAE